MATVRPLPRAVPRPGQWMVPIHGRKCAPRAAATTVESGAPPVVRPGPAQLPVEGSRLARSWSNLEFLVVKVTRRCNLSCSYCYEDIGSGSDMTLDTFMRMADAAFDSTDRDRVGFLFHGGEPTLLDVGWYRAAMDYADGVARGAGKTAEYTIQSNLVRLDQPFLDLFLERGVSIGVSMDGPPEMNDDSRGAGSAVVRNFMRAKSAGLQVSVLATINHSNWNRMPEVIHWLRTDLGERRFKANVAYPVGAGLDAQPLTGEQIFKARKDILDHMLETGGNGVIEANLERELIKFADKRGCGKSLCDGQLCGAGSRVLGVTPEGNLLPCGRFEWNDRAWSLGNIGQTDEDAFRSRGEQLRRFWGASDYNWADCGTCRARHMCSYSCQAFVVRSKRQLNIECAPTLSLYDYLVEQPQGRVEALVATLKLHSAMGTAEYRDGGSSYNDYGYNDKGYNDAGYTDR
ncbi:unnamed protein product [Ostreobium quekettii]|uniref:Radical SAM core domain-containing protein n=1 Tax=Ostreobium quekettii TaxID=121088 RepID=A0A8S1JDH2_9CHLO|nr:unnamed protein product [Ostreobium quekettii]|eukprot:evm.model.scf_1692.4 EVM.evm.TU.scf_1692.4   scf_1692:19585-21502(-)